MSLPLHEVIEFGEIPLEQNGRHAKFLSRFNGGSCLKEGHFAAQFGVVDREHRNVAGGGGDGAGGQGFFVRVGGNDDRADVVETPAFALDDGKIAQRATGGGVVIEDGDDVAEVREGGAEFGEMALGVLAGAEDGEAGPWRKRRGAAAEVGECGGNFGERRILSPGGVPIPLAGDARFVPGDAAVGQREAFEVFIHEAQRLRHVDEGVIQREAQPKFVVAGGDHGGIEGSGVGVHSAPPHGMRADETAGEEQCAVVIGPAHVADAAGIVPTGVGVVGECAVGIGQCVPGVIIERGREDGEHIGMVAVIGVGAGEIFSTGEVDGAVPGGVEGFARFRTVIADAFGAVYLLEFVNDGGFVLGWRCCRSRGFRAGLSAESLRGQVLQAASHEAFAVVGGDDGGGGDGRFELARD